MKNDAQTEIRLKGMAMSPGLAITKVCMFNEGRHSNLPIYKISGSGVDFEIARIKKAIEIAGARIEELRLQVKEKIGEAEAEIFVAQKMILQDLTLFKKVCELVRE